MLIHSNGRIEKDAQFNLISTGSLKHYTRGLVYASECYKTEEICAEVHREWKRTGEINFELLQGAFTYVLESPEDKILVFSDNSNMHCLYSDGKRVSNSFLELLQHKIFEGEMISFDDEAVCELLTLGRVYFGQTCIKGIEICGRNEYYEVCRDRVKRKNKKLKDFSSVDYAYSMEKQFDELALALNDKKVCQALTGGYDSRLVFAFLNNRINTDPFLSGEHDVCSEIGVAKDVAQRAGKSLDIVKVDRPKVTFSLIHELFHATDGVVPFADSGTYRIVRFTQLKEEDYDLLVTGDGGVMHKDWEWMQDLPFYHKRTTNLARYYNQRIEMLDYTSYLSDHLKSQHTSQKQRFVNQLSIHVKETNTKSYDNLYYEVNGNRNLYYNRPLTSINIYAPLNELKLVRGSYQLPRRKRFFYYNIRENMTRENLAIARMRTNYGTTASNELLFLLRDIIFQVLDYSRKLIRALGRKLLNRQFFVGKVLSWDLLDVKQNRDLLEEARVFCVESNWINDDVKLEAMDGPFLSRIMYLYTLNNFIKQDRQGHDAHFENIQVESTHGEQNQ